MYSWITHTWNPLGGECPHGCTYCSTNKLMRYPVIKEKYSGPPKLIEKELKANIRTSNFIFVCAQSDLFAEDISDFTTVRVLNACSIKQGSDESIKFLFQSKNPERMALLWMAFPRNSTICTTIETNRIYPQMGKTPPPQERANYMSELRKRGFDTYVTIEPIMKFDLWSMIELIKMCNPVQVNIGADSGNNNLPEPTKSEVLQLITELEKFTKIDRKTNLSRLI